MKSSLIVLFLVISIILTYSSCKQISDTSPDELQFHKKLIEDQLELNEEPWRWYHFVGIGVAILVVFNCLRCCFPLCLTLCCGCGVFLFALISEWLGRGRVYRTEDLGYKQNNKGQKNERTDQIEQEQKGKNQFGYPDVDEDKENLYPDVENAHKQTHQDKYD